MSGNKLLNVLSKNTFSNFVFSFVNIALELIQYAVLIRFMEMEAYGILIFAGAILGQFNFLEIGLGIGLSKFIPEFKLKGEQAKISQAIVATTGLFVIMGLIVSAVLLILVMTDSLGSLFKVEDIATTQNLVLLVCLFAPFSWGGKALLGGLKGFNQHHEVNVINSSIRLFQFLAVCLLAFFSFDVLWLFLSLQLFEIIRLIWFQYTLSRLHKIETKDVIHIQNLVSTIKQIFGYSMWVFIMQLSGMLINQFDKMIVSALIGIEQLVVYTGIVKLIRLLTIISNRLNGAVIPIAAELNISSGSVSSFNKAAMRGVRVINAIAVPIVAITIIAAEPVLTLIGKEYLLEYKLTYQIGMLLYAVAGACSFLGKMLVGAGNIIRFLSLYNISKTILYLLTVGASIEYGGLVGAILILPIIQVSILPIWLFFVKKLAEVELLKLAKAILSGQWPSLLVIALYFILPEEFNIYLLVFSVVFLAVTSVKFTIEKPIKDILMSYAGFKKVEK